MPDDTLPAVSPLKPYHRTSYFLLLVATLVVGPLALWGLTYLLPHFPVPDSQRIHIFEIALQGWLWIVATVGGGNVFARGLVSFGKTLANAPVKDPESLKQAVKESVMNEVVPALNNTLTQVTLNATKTASEAAVAAASSQVKQHLEQVAPLPVVASAEPEPQASRKATAPGKKILDAK